MVAKIKISLPFPVHARSLGFFRISEMPPQHLLRDLPTAFQQLTRLQFLLGLLATNTLSSSFIMSLSSFFSSFVSTVYADAPAEEPAEPTEHKEEDSKPEEAEEEPAAAEENEKEEEEEEEPEDVSL